MAISYFCAECNYETEDKACPLCMEKTDQITVKDDPLYGTPNKDAIYVHSSEEEVY